MVEQPGDRSETRARTGGSLPAERGCPGGVYIALGSNLGDREGTIRAALHDLEAQRDVRVVRCSRLHETDPVGGPPGQGRYLNAVAELQTELSPHELLARLMEIERRHGRKRGVVHGPRTLDLDLLLYRERVIDEQDLVVPHPRMWERPFVMQPLEEIRGAGMLAAGRKVSRSEPRAQAGGC